MRITKLALLLPLLVSGCITTVVTPYPQDWPSEGPAKSATCGDIAGTFYLKAARSAKPDHVQVSDRLDEILFTSYLADFSENAKAELAYKSDIGEVALSLPDKTNRPQKGYVRLHNQVTCEDGWIHVQTVRDFHNEGTSHSYTSFTKLKILADGNLLVNQRRVRKSRALFVAVYGADAESWYIFGRIK